MQKVKVETRRPVNNKQGGGMKRIMVGLLVIAVNSGTAWAQTPVTPAQGPVAVPASVAAPAPVTAPKTWVDYITLRRCPPARRDD